jgi:hypothetical protein
LRTGWGGLFIVAPTFDGIHFSMLGGGFSQIAQEEEFLADWRG